MDDYKKIEILEKFLGRGNYSASNHEWLIYCQACNHYKRKLSINLKTLKWHCWVCDKKGHSLRPLLKDFCTQEEIATIHKEFLDLKKDDQSGATKQEDLKLELPKGFQTLFECKDSIIGRKMYDYLLNGRRISEEDILKYRLGITQEDRQFENRIIFPSFDKNGELNFFVGRTVIDNKLKYLSSRNEKHKIIINELNIDFGKPLTIVEGYFDMLKVNENATFLSGSELSHNSRLFQEIVKNKTIVYLALDSDAIKKIMKLAEKFGRYGIEVYIVSVLPYKDCGEMSKIEFMKHYKDAKKYQFSDSLKNKIAMVN